MKIAHFVPFIALVLIAGCANDATTTTPTTTQIVNTLTPTAITSTSATLNGDLNPSGLSTSAFFQWGTTTSYGSTTAPQALGSGTATVNVTANVTGLTPTTVYHYRLVSTNTAGTAMGEDAIFTTTSTSPAGSEFFAGTLAPQGSSFYAFTVSTAAPVNITLISLTLSPIITLPDTVVGIGYGTPVGEGCTITSSLNTSPGLIAQLTVPSPTGIFCASIFDIGSLTAPVSFVLRIAHS